MAKGYLSIVLHAHLPYVRHPEKREYLEERWFFEGMTETYIPIASMLLKLRQDNVPAKLTISLSPTLLAMMSDELLQKRYLKHLKGLVELAEKEVKRTASHPTVNYTARIYEKQLTEALDLLERYDKNLINTYRDLRDSGILEVMTCSATHGYLPVLSINGSSVRAQVAIAVQHFREVFGGEPSGMWLPECGYYRGLERVLADYGVRYFILETHGLLNADPSPNYGVFAPVRCPGGVHAFGRDAESAKQVWSAQEGYPGDADYREFYRDIGYDLDMAYIGPYIHDNHFRVDTGFKYYRITGKTEHKQPYEPDWAREKAAVHAGNFVFNRQRQVEHYGAGMDRPPIVVTPYDAELFGHWWFEGPMWIDFVARKIAYDQDILEMVTPSQYLSRHGAAQEVLPAISSWGFRGFHEVWLNGTNDWVWPYLHWAGRRMREVASKYKGQNGIIRAGLEQMGRELLLAESSDWPFIMHNKTSVQYAEHRFRDHMKRFKYLYDRLQAGTLEQRDVDTLRTVDNIFSSVPVEVWE